MATPDQDLTHENLSPTDALALYEKMAAGEPVGGTEDTKPGDEQESTAANTDEVKKTEQPPGMDTGQEQTAEGIESKNGKHILPFTVLTGEREQRQAAQRERDEALAKYQAAQTELEQLRAKQNSNPGDADTTRATELMDRAGDLTEAELQELKEDFPTVYKAVAKLQAISQQTAESVAAKVDPIHQAYESAQVRQADQLRASVQDAIDANPKLAHIQANDPAMFAVAQQCDEVLRGTPAWANKPMAERFAQAVALAELSTGKTIEIASAQAGAAPAVDLKAAALAKAKQQHAEMPTSLQQFPAGAAPKETALDELQGMTAAQIALKLASMSSADQAAYFANL